MCPKPARDPRRVRRDRLLMSLVGLAPTEWYVYFLSALVDVSFSVLSANIFI